MPQGPIYPVSRRFIGWGKEAVVGTPVLPAVTMPVNKFDPEDKPTWLKDSSWRNSMGSLYGMQQGPLIADLDLAGPVYGDTIGHPLVNVMGDYAVTGSSPANATTLSAQANAGATSITLTSTTGYVNGALIQIGSGTSAEVRRQVGAPAGSVVTLDAALYYTHASAQPVAVVVAPFTHVFAMLNNGTGAGGAQVAQPPTHTLHDVTGITATVGSRAYRAVCMSDVNFTGNAEQFLNWDGKATTWVSTPSASAPTAAVSGVPAQASWRSLIGIGGPASGGTLVSNIKEWGVNLSRELDPKFTNSNSQNPYAIPRGGLGVTGKLTFDPAIDETPLLNMLNNSQPQLQIIADNGLLGANQVTLTFDCLLAAYDTSKLDSGGVVFGYNTSFQAIDNTTNVGQSAGFGPCLITLKNAVPTY